MRSYRRTALNLRHPFPRHTHPSRGAHDEYCDLSNTNGASTASLVLSNPAAPQRHCVFINMCFTSAIFQSRESQGPAARPPTEYACRYLAADDGREIAFDNQNG
jgi:hypothetical protein